MTPRRRTALAAVLVAGSAVWALPAHAVVPAYAVVPADAEDRLVLSGDGMTWAPDITTPLLDPDLVWVPGDVMTGTLYARNVSDDDASAAVTVHLDGGPDGAGDPLVDELDLRVRTGDGPWTDGPTSAITDLAPGEEVPIGIEVGFDPAATNVTQRRTAQLDVVVTLSAVGSDGGGQGGPGSAGPDRLPRTGADLLLAAVLAAGGIVVGILMRKGARHD